MMKRDLNRILVDAYSHLIGITTQDDYEYNKEKVKEYIHADPSGKRLFKCLSYNTYCYLTDPFGYKDEESFNNEDFYLLYVIGVINEVRHINPDYEDMIIACTKKDKIIPYLKLQTGIKGLIDIYGAIDYMHLFEKVQYAFDSELFEIDAITVDKTMFSEPTAPILAAFAYEEDGYYIRRELEGHFEEFHQQRKKQCCECDYADYESDYILDFSSSFKPNNIDVELQWTPELIKFFRHRQFSILTKIAPEDLGFETDDILHIQMYHNLYPNWLYKGHCPSDMSSIKFMDSLGIN